MGGVQTQQFTPDEIGEYVSALANSRLYRKGVCLSGLGVEDGSHDVLGTTFVPGEAKVGNEQLETWLLRLLAPKVHFKFVTILVDGKTLL